MPKLGIIAGGGTLPGQIIDACRETGRDFHVLAFKGAARADLFGDAPVEWIRMSGLSKALDAARRAGIDELVLVGNIPRPSVGELMRDMRSAKFMAKVGTRMLGDNSLLSAVIRELEETEGFRVVGAETLLPDILAAEGIYGAVEPTADDRADIERGLDAARTIGRLDIGQAVVVQNGIVLGVEAAEGTDSLIARCAPFVDRKTPGGVLVKVAKPGQERRADLPAVGQSTVANVAAAGLRGIAIEAGSALVVDRVATVSSADRHGIFVVGTGVAG